MPIRSYEWYVSKTYFQSNKNKGFISLISYISIIGMMLGTAAVIIASAFFGGMTKEISDRFIGIDSHVKVSGFFNRPIQNYEAMIDSIRKIEGVEAISPKIFNSGMIKAKNGNITRPVLVNGIDLERSKEVGDIKNRLISGAFDLGYKKVWNERRQRFRSYPGIVLGQYLADDLNLSILDTGKVLFVSALPKDIELTMTPTIQPFYFAGIVDLGLAEYNTTFAYTNLQATQYLFQLPNQASFLDIRLDKVGFKNIEHTTMRIDSTIDYPYKARTWEEDRKGIFSVLEFEKKIYMLALSLICCLAGFNILSTIYMLVKDKTKEIGVLRSLGTKKASVMKIFIYQGSIIGIIGAIGGTILGLAIVMAQDVYKLIRFPKNTMIIDYLPVDIQYDEIIPLMIFVIIISTLAAVYPAYKAAQLKPVEAFRYE